MTDGEMKMLTKTMIALATALTLGAASVALAANENDGQTGGYRELGPGGVVTDGVNPIFHPSMRGSSGKAYDYVVPPRPAKHAPAK
jgi:hypothetical protein